MTTTIRVLLAAGLLFAANGALADVVTFPSAGCAGTLQQCIDAAGAGDTIEIATDTLINEDLTIQKSLTLKSASGFTGTIGNPEAAERTVNILDSSISGAIDVTLDGLVLENARIDASLGQFAAGGHHVEVLRTRVLLDIDNNNTAGVSINLNVPATAVVRRNLIDSTGQAIQLRSGLVGGAATFTVDGNVLTTSDPAQSTTGVEMRFAGGGTVLADVVNNVASGVAGCFCGGSGGVTLLTTGSVVATVNILHNTLDDIDNSATAIEISPPGLTSQLTVNLFNNVVTRGEGVGLGIFVPIATPQLTVNNDSNDFFFNDLPNELGGYSLGPNTSSVAPGFVGFGDFHLQAGSALVDAGTSAPPGGLPALDADGNPRVAGAAPDLGAYEFAGPFPSTTTSTVTVVSTTSTTLASDACAPAATFPSVGCRLGVLRGQAEDEVGDGRLSGKLGAVLTSAKAAVRLAEELAADGGTKPVRRALGKALRALAKLEKLLGSVPSPLRESLSLEANGIATDVRTLRGS
jgi:hypothetical protein